MLAISGSAADSIHASVVALLERQLQAMGLSLVERPRVGSLAGWAREATRSKRALLAIALEVSKDSGWRLILVDVSRGRAIARELPGGIDRDAASVEAIVSIAISAASALREGLEVASSPVEEVVGGAPPPAAVSVPLPPPEPIPTAPGRAFVRGALGAEVAYFAPSVPSMKGVALALGVSWRNRAEARLFGALFWPASIQSDFGTFRLNRIVVGAAVGPVFSSGDFTFVPEAGVLVERLRRSETLPAQEVFANQAAPLHRGGGVVDLRLRYALVRPLSIELVGGVAYLGRGAQFSVRNGNSRPLLEGASVMPFAQLGLDIATE
ncbi:MAG TPA: hypothetical protein VHP33_01625 [Polyangiaceae bacterium]|nr:hypothetical protein [Polyangiaceae bacterium]